MLSHSGLLGGHSHSTTSRRPLTSRISMRFPGSSRVLGFGSSDDPKRLGSTCVPLRSVGSVAFPKRMSFLMITIRILHVYDATLVLPTSESLHNA
ncbi:MAG: hypothetical protein JWO52_2158 [Gammaproteobacteria bacterium]|nr:hypothetical protein [Gammaproteobacteria bacterium]